MTNPFRKLESPSGIDLYPAPPTAVRLSRRAGILALIVVCAVVALIGYGVITSRQRSVDLMQVDGAKSLTAATEVGKTISADVPAKSLAGAPATDDDADSDETEHAEDWDELGGPRPGTPWRPDAQLVAVRQPTPPSTIPALTPEQKRRIAAFQLEQQAMEAPTATGSGSQAPTATRTSIDGISAPGTGSITDLVRSVMGRGTDAGGQRSAPQAMIAELREHPTEDDGDSARVQEDRERFVERARKDSVNDVFPATRRAPLSPYEIKAGWDIPAVLEHGLNSDLPGEVRALVRENVYDTATGKYLLIPQGSRLVGVYDSRIAYGQDGLMVVWNRIIFPDGSSIRLDGMASQDASGQSGLRHKVDNHYRRLLGFAALTSVFSAAFQLSQSPRGGILAYPSAGEMAGTAVGRELSQFGTQVTRRNLNVQPTIRIPVGYRFNVRVNQDLVFRLPLKPDGIGR